MATPAWTMSAKWAAPASPARIARPVAASRSTSGMARCHAPLVAGGESSGVPIDQGDVDIVDRSVPHAAEAAQRIAPIAGRRVEDDVARLHDDIGFIDDSIDPVAARKVENKAARMLQLRNEPVELVD